MSTFVILVGLALCFGSILVPLKLVELRGAKRTKAHKAMPIVGYILGVCGLILVVGTVEAKRSMIQDSRAGEDGVVVAEQLCKELTFHGWTNWRNCERASD